MSRSMLVLQLLFLTSAPFAAQQALPAGPSASSDEIPVDGLFRPGVPPATQAADLDGDGLPDVFEAIGNRVLVYPGRRDRSFGGPILSNVGLKNSPLGMAAADFDSDGDLDLAVDLNTFEIRILFNQGDGRFIDGQLFQDLAIGTAKPADWDGDGDQDIVTVSGFGSVFLYTNNGLGVFTGGSFAGTSSRDAVVGDMNRDGLPDLVYAAGTVIRITPSIGPTFGASVDYPSAGATGARLADLDGDGFLDVVCGRSSGSELLIHLNDGAGGLGPAQLFATGGSTLTGSHVGTPADFDRDGDLDVLVGSTLERVSGRSTSGLRFMANDGAGTFTAGQLLVTGFSSSYETADLGGDGWFDVLLQTATLVNRGRGRFASFEARPMPHVLPTSFPGEASLAAADVDADGDQDLVYGSPVGGGSRTELVLAANDGTGHFTATPISTLTNRQTATSLFADLDGSGSADILMVDRNFGTSQGVVTSLLNDGTGVFNAATSTPTNSAIWDFAVGDLDRDGDLDAVFVADLSSELIVAINNGAGFLSGFLRYATGGSSRALALGDADLDGDTDAFVTNGLMDAVEVHANEGTGAFALSAVVPMGDQPEDVLLRDLDGDGAMDLATANLFGQSASVRLGLSGGGLGAERRYELPFGGAVIDAADLDADGRLDLVLAPLATLRNRGGGLFAPAAELGSPGVAWTVTARDFDGDGDVDLAAPCANALGRPIVLYRNRLR